MENEILTGELVESADPEAAPAPEQINDAQNSMTLFHSLTSLEGLDADTKVDFIEHVIVGLGKPIEFPLEHRFAPGMYVREIFMPAGSLLTSKIHNTEHFFMVLEGSAFVWSENDGPQFIEAPFIGTTHPGTRRVLYIVNDMRWATVHPGTETTAEDVEERIITKRINPPLPSDLLELAEQMIANWNTQPEIETGGTPCLG